MEKMNIAVPGTDYYNALKKTQKLAFGNDERSRPKTASTKQYDYWRPEDEDEDAD